MKWAEWVEQDLAYLTYFTYLSSSLSYSIRVTSVLNSAYTELYLALVFFFKILVLRIIFLIMHCIISNNLLLTDYIDWTDIIFMSCINCSRYTCKYYVSYDFKWCSECIYYYVYCNTLDLLVLNWKKLKHEENYINTAILTVKATENKTWACYYYLKKQQKFLKKCDSEILYYSFKTLDKLN